MRSVSVGRSPAITSSSSRSCGSRGERAGDFEPLAIRQRQRRGDPVALVEQIEALQQRLRARAGRRRRRADAAARRSITLSSTLSAGNGRTI